MAVSKNILQQKKEKQYLILDLNFVPYTSNYSLPLKNNTFVFQIG